MRRATLLLMLLVSFAHGQALKHIIIIVKENRSLDHYFGQFPGITGGPITFYNCVGTQGGCSGGITSVHPAEPNQQGGEHDNYHFLAKSIQVGPISDLYRDCNGSVQRHSSGEHHVPGRLDGAENRDIKRWERQLHDIRSIGRNSQHQCNI